jgi:hypothetical protein
VAICVKSMATSSQAEAPGLWSLCWTLSKCFDSILAETQTILARDVTDSPQPIFKKSMNKLARIAREQLDSPLNTVDLCGTGEHTSFGMPSYGHSGEHIASRVDLDAKCFDSALPGALSLASFQADLAHSPKLAEECKDNIDLPVTQAAGVLGGLVIPAGDTEFNC